MAGEWIKMKANLCTSPKVIRIAKFIEDDREVGKLLSTGYNGALREIVTRNVTRDVTLASLFRVWSAANEHTTDGVWNGIEISDLDDIAGVPGFGEAMELVEWAIFDEEKQAVIFPNFLEHNAPAKDGARNSNAERQRRYRQKKKAEDGESNVTRNVTGDVTDNVTRNVTNNTEKRREEKSIKERESACAREVSIPTLAEITVAADRVGMTESEAKRFFEHYEGNNLWVNQHGRLIKWQTKLSTWKTNERKYDGSKNINGRNSKRIDNNAGTFNEGKTGQYATSKLGRVT